jgi:hypothetical protein
MVSGGGRDRGTEAVLTEEMRGSAVGPVGCASSRGSSVTCTWRENADEVSYHRWPHRGKTGDMRWRLTVEEEMQLEGGVWTRGRSLLKPRDLSGGSSRSG